MVIVQYTVLEQAAMQAPQHLHEHVSFAECDKCDICKVLDDQGTMHNKNNHDN